MIGQQNLPPVPHRRLQTMSPSTLVAMLMVLVASASVSMANMGESQKPNMPHVFQNEKQLSQYLQALDDYYLLLGKPRFGRSFQDSYETRRWNLPYTEFLRTV
ncbi:pro-neuropeptide Y-like isoform X1 [Dermacentor variabilis]|uniref:pro-neuropeptide Y-like isoform X1 n=1 Tax=Dermacentor variabilis TaxID=34621 RepID=UPI003F5B230B